VTGPPRPSMPALWFTGRAEVRARHTSSVVTQIQPFCAGRILSSSKSQCARMCAWRAMQRALQTSRSHGFRFSSNKMSCAGSRVEPRGKVVGAKAK